MKTNRHSLMAKGIMVLLSLLVLVFAFTYSWFTIDNETVTATGLSASVDPAGDFEYAIGFKNSQTFGRYAMTKFTNESTALQFDKLSASTDGGGTYELFNLLYDYTPIDVTGDGGTLIRPAMSYGNSMINTSSNDYSLADPNVQYITFDLFFRSESSGVPINLGNNSYALGACEINGNGKNDVGNGAMTDTSKANTTYGFNKSTYGDFSKDAIVGAIRVAFVPYTFENTENSVSGLNGSNIMDDTSSYLTDTASLLWLPRPDLRAIPSVNAQGDELMTGWTLNTAATDETYTVGESTYHNNKHSYYAIFQNGNHNIVEYNDTVTPVTLASANQEFTSIGSQVKIGDYYYTKVNVRIWVEGTDPEARRALSGGQFAVNFKFTTNN